MESVAIPTLVVVAAYVAGPRLWSLWESLWQLLGMLAGTGMFMTVMLMDLSWQRGWEFLKCLAFGKDVRISHDELDTVEIQQQLSEKVLPLICYLTVVAFVFCFQYGSESMFAESHGVAKWFRINKCQCLDWFYWWVLSFPFLVGSTTMTAVVVQPKNRKKLVAHFREIWIVEMEPRNQPARIVDIATSAVLVEMIVPDWFWPLSLSAFVLVHKHFGNFAGA